jgi:RNA polymerase sigma-70 factor (ECF subfamily)
MRLFLANQKRFFGVILSLVGNIADAEDVLQDVSVVMWQKFDTYRSGTDFAAWGLRIARLETMNFVRKRRRAGFVAFDEALLESVSQEVVSATNSSEERGQALQDCLRKLPIHSRTLIELRYEPGANPKAVAQRMGRSIESVYKALTRTHEALMQCIELKLSKGFHN